MEHMEFTTSVKCEVNNLGIKRDLLKFLKKMMDHFFPLQGALCDIVGHWDATIFHFSCYIYSLEFQYSVYVKYVI